MLRPCYYFCMFEFLSYICLFLVAFCLYKVHILITLELLYVVTCEAICNLFESLSHICLYILVALFLVLYEVHMLMTLKLLYLVT